MSAGVEPLERGDHVEIARRVIEALRAKRGRLHLGRSGVLCAVDRGIEVHLTHEAECLIVGLAGTPITGGGTLRVNRSTLRDVLKVARFLV